MIDTLYLHVGLPKTGSSSIQATFFRSRQMLREHGVLYPRSHSSHFFLASAFAKEPLKLRINILNNRTTQASLDDYHRTSLEDLTDQAMRRNWTVAVLSSESIRANPGALKRLKSYLESLCRRILIVVYVRHPLHDAQSRCQQRIKIGAMTWDDMFSSEAAGRHLRMVNPSRHLDCFASVFGSENLIKRPFERSQMIAGDVIDDFISTVGLDDLAGWKRPTAVNSSISQEAAFAISEVSNAYPRIVNGEATGPDARILRKLDGRHFRLPRIAIDRLTSEATRYSDELYRRHGIKFERDEVEAFDPNEADAPFRAACREIIASEMELGKWHPDRVLDRIRAAYRVAYGGESRSLG